MGQMIDSRPTPLSVGCDCLTANGTPWGNNGCLPPFPHCARGSVSCVNFTGKALRENKTQQARKEYHRTGGENETKQCGGQRCVLLASQK